MERLFKEEHKQFVPTVSQGLEKVALKAGVLWLADRLMGWHFAYSCPKVELFENVTCWINAIEPDMFEQEVMLDLLSRKGVSFADTVDMLRPLLGEYYKSEMQKLNEKSEAVQ